MCAVPQLVSAPLNPIPNAEHFKEEYKKIVYCLWNETLKKLNHSIY